MAPTPGPCPVEQEVCDFAVRLLQLVQAQDVDTFMSLTEPTSFTCTPEVRLPGPGTSLDACKNAKDGEVVPGYPVSHGGEGTIEGEASFRDYVENAVENANAYLAEGDAYGPGLPIIAGIRCSRPSDLAAGTCADDRASALITYVSPSVGLNSRRAIRGVLIVAFAPSPAGGTYTIRAIGFDTAPSGLLPDEHSNAYTGTTSTFYPWRP